jgi:hypothetical protein
MRLEASDGSAMTDDRKSMTPEPQDREAARRKLIGRAMVVLLLALVAVYVFVTFRR